MAEKRAVKYFGGKPSELAAGGVFPDGVYEIVGIKSEHWNYNKAVDMDADNLSTFVQMDLAPCKKTGERIKAAKIVDQHWSVGNATKVLPSKDGKRLKAGPESNQDGVSPQSNWGFFVAQFGMLGADESFLTDDLTSWKGVKAKFVSVPQPERTQMAALEEDEGPKKGPRTIPVIAEMISYPGGKSAAVKDEEEEEEEKPAKKPAKKAVKAAEPDEDEDDDEKEEEDEEETEDEEDAETEDEDDDESPDSLFSSTIAKVLGKVKTIKSKMLPVEVFKLLNGNDNQAAVAKMFKDAKAVAVEVKKAGFKLDGENFVKGK